MNLSAGIAGPSRKYPNYLRDEYYTSLHPTFKPQDVDFVPSNVKKFTLAAPGENLVNLDFLPLVSNEQPPFNSSSSGGKGNLATVVLTILFSFPAIIGS